MRPRKINRRLQCEARHAKKTSGDGTNLHAGNRIVEDQDASGGASGAVQYGTQPGCFRMMKAAIAAYLNEVFYEFKQEGGATNYFLLESTLSNPSAFTGPRPPLHQQPFQQASGTPLETLLHPPFQGGRAEVAIRALIIAVL